MERPSKFLSLRKSGKEKAFISILDWLESNQKKYVNDKDPVFDNGEKLGLYEGYEEAIIKIREILRNY